jgi:hypothetical protein
MFHALCAWARGCGRITPSRRVDSGFDRPLADEVPPGFDALSTCLKVNRFVRT